MLSPVCDTVYKCVTRWVVWTEPDRLSRKTHVVMNINVCYRNVLMLNESVETTEKHFFVVAPRSSGSQEGESRMWETWSREEMTKTKCIFPCGAALRVVVCSGTTILPPSSQWLQSKSQPLMIELPRTHVRKAVFVTLFDSWWSRRHRVEDTDFFVVDLNGICDWSSLLYYQLSEKNACRGATQPSVGIVTSKHHRNIKA